MRNLLLGRLEFYKNTNNKLGEGIANMEIEELEKNENSDFGNSFKTCYSRPGKANFFKKRILLFSLFLMWLCHSIKLNLLSIQHIIFY